MSIQNLNSRDVVSIHKSASIFEAVKLMKENNIGDIVVVENEKSSMPIGILTDRDIAMKLVFDELDITALCVGDVMSYDLLILKKEQNTHESLEMMYKKGVRRAPIVDDNNQLCGIATVDDLLILIADELSKLAKLVHKQIQQ